MILYAIRTERQRDARRGQQRVCRTLSRAFEMAHLLATNTRQRMYVVIIHVGSYLP